MLIVIICIPSHNVGYMFTWKVYRELLRIYFCFVYVVTARNSWSLGRTSHVDTESVHVLCDYFNMTTDTNLLYKWIHKCSFCTISLVCWFELLSRVIHYTAWSPISNWIQLLYQYSYTPNRLFIRFIIDDTSMEN